jgi:hypothetical protein
MGHISHSSALRLLSRRWKESMVSLATLSTPWSSEDGVSELGGGTDGSGVFVNKSVCERRMSGSLDGVFETSVNDNVDSLCERRADIQCENRVNGNSSDNGRKMDERTKAELMDLFLVTLKQSPIMTRRDIKGPVHALHRPASEKKISTAPIDPACIWIDLD